MLKTRVNDNFIVPNEKNSDKVVDFVKKSINKSKNPYMTIDISSLNIIEASKVAALGATYHYLKFPDNGEIDWIVCSNEIEKLLCPLNLGNSNFFCNKV